ncbi:MAG: RidA family protein [Alphaproteobacteria bacterium]
MTATALKPTHFPWMDYARYSFSLGLKAGERTYLSGHTASEYDRDTKRMVIKGGMAEQTRTAYDKLEAILAADGKTLADVIRLVEYVTPDGIERYAEAEAVRRERLGDKATVNTVPVKALLRRDAYIELEATAGPGTALVGGAVDSAGLVYLPTLHGRGGDLVAQCHDVFDQAETLLKPLGLGLDAVVKTVEFIPPDVLPIYKESAKVRRERFTGVYPAATGIIMPRLVRDDAMVQIDITATRDTPETVNPGWSRFEKLTYSPGVKAGKLLFLSGMMALDPETGAPAAENDVVAEAEATYTRILEVVAAAGGGPRNLVKTIEYTTPAAQATYRDVAKVRQRLFELPFPASTGPLCETLLRPTMNIEICSIGVLD